MKARKGNKVQKLISILAYGEQGTWKSSLGMEAGALKRVDGKPMRVLVFDAEFGGVDTALEEKASEYGFDEENFYIVYTESYSDIMNYLDKVKNNEDFYELDEDGNETDEVVLDADGKPFRADFIVLDGSTVVYNASSIAKVKFSEKRAKVKAKNSGLNAEETAVKVQGADLEFKDYKKLNTEMSQELILKLISTGVHHYITAREVDEKRTETYFENGEKKTTSVPTGKKIPEGFKNMGYNVGTVIRLYIDEEFGGVKGEIVNKDRTRVHKQGEIIEEPSLLDYQVVIDGNKGKNKVNLTPTFSDSIDKEYEKELEENNMKEKELKSPEEFHEKIKEILKTLSAEKKKSLATKLKEKNLPKSYSSITDIEQLKLYLNILNE